MSQKSPAELVKLRELLLSKKWPLAKPGFISKYDFYLKLVVLEDLATKKVLNVSCGFDRLANHLPEFCEFDNLDIFNKNRRYEPNSYDIIFIYDVIDHYQFVDGIHILNMCKRLLAPEGRIYMRCHPWTSRHATHLTHALNKAFIHLIFTDQELKTIDPELVNVPSLKTLTPILTYNSLITQHGLKIVKRNNITETVEDFFWRGVIYDRIMTNNKFTKQPDFPMSLQYVDYILAKQ